MEGCLPLRVGINTESSWFQFDKMTTKFFAIVFWLAWAVSAMGQAAINLNNRGFALVRDASGKPLTGSSYVAQIWYGPNSNLLNKSFAPAPFRPSTTAYPGTWNPAATGGPGAIATLEGFTLGSTVTLRVAVWDLALYLNWQEAQGKPNTGLSDPFEYHIPAAWDAIPGGMENFKGLTLSASGIPVNQPPIAYSQATNVVSGQSVKFILYGFDPEGASLTYRIITPPQNGTLVNLLYTPQSGFVGVDSFNFVVNDGSKDSQLAAVSINVTPKPAILNAYWTTPNKTNTCYDGTLVRLNAKVIGFEIGDDIQFNLFEDDGLFGRQDRGTASTKVYRDGNSLYATAEWSAKWEVDTNNPEFIFDVVGKGVVKTSDQLTVIPPDANDRIISAEQILSVSKTRTINERIDLPDDVDIYSFSAKSGQDISFDVIRTEGAIQPVLRLFNSNGDELQHNYGDSTTLSPNGNEVYISHKFLNDGVYYIGVSGAGNTLYNPSTGNGDLIGGCGGYQLTVSAGYAGHIKKPGSDIKFLVDLQREDISGAAIDVSKNTWVVIHGWNSSRNEPNITALVSSLKKNRPNDQVLTLDWSSLADTGLVNVWDLIIKLDITSAVREAAKGITPTGKWAASILRYHGFRADQLNIIGHSFGCYVADQLADVYQPDKLNSMIALDPAANAVPEVFNPRAEVNYIADFAWSWAFHSSGLGNDYVPGTATEAFIVDSGLITTSAHSMVVNFFAYILENPLQSISSFFSLDRLLNAAFGPWVLDVFRSSFAADSGFQFYEAIVTDPDGVVPKQIKYIDNSPILSIQNPKPNEVFVSSPITVAGYSTDFGRGDSGIKLVTVNGVTADGGVANGGQTAYWSNSVSLKMGDNTIKVVSTDKSSLNVGVVTNVVNVKYQPEFIEIETQYIDELAQFSIDLASGDKSLSDRPLNHFLKTGPSGLSVSASGRLNWTPSESQGPSTNLVEISVNDGYVGTTKRILIVVREMNNSPSLAVLNDLNLTADVDWSMRVFGNDIDLPAQTLTYSLRSSPQGMTINSIDGEIRWRPSRGQRLGTYPVIVTVADPTGALSERAFNVTVLGVIQTPLVTISPMNGDGSISLSIQAEMGIMVALETSGDMSTWVEMIQVKGEGIGNPVKQVFQTDPNTQSKFWRVRMR